MFPSGQPYRSSVDEFRDRGFDGFSRSIQRSGVSDTFNDPPLGDFGRSSTVSRNQDDRGESYRPFDDVGSSSLRHNAGSRKEPRQTFEHGHGEPSPWVLRDDPLAGNQLDDRPLRPDVEESRNLFSGVRFGDAVPSDFSQTPSTFSENKMEKHLRDLKLEKERLLRETPVDAKKILELEINEHKLQAKIFQEFTEVQNRRKDLSRSAQEFDAALFQQRDYEQRAQRALELHIKATKALSEFRDPDLEFARNSPETARLERELEQWATCEREFGALALREIELKRQAQNSLEYDKHARQELQYLQRVENARSCIKRIREQLQVKWPPPRQDIPMQEQPLCIAENLEREIQDHMEREREYFDCAKQERELKRLAKTQHEFDAHASRELEFQQLTIQERQVREHKAYQLEELRQNPPPVVSPAPISANLIAEIDSLEKELREVRSKEREFTDLLQKEWDYRRLARSPAEIAQCERQIRDLEARVASARAIQDRILSRLNDINREIQTLEVTSKAIVPLDTLDHDIARLEHEIRQHSLKEQELIDSAVVERRLKDSARSKMKYDEHARNEQRYNNLARETLERKIIAERALTELRGKVPKGPLSADLSRSITRTDEITTRLPSGDRGSFSNARERSLSSDPIFNEEGNRMNYRDGRIQNKLEVERHTRTQEDLAKTPDYIPAPDNTPKMLTEKVMIPQDDYPDVNFIALLLGPKGAHMKELAREIGAKVILRGKGTHKSVAPGTVLPGANEPLHAFITAPNPDILNKAIQRIHEMIQNLTRGRTPVKKDLPTSAPLNKTEEFVWCRECRSKTHPPGPCPKKVKVHTDRGFPERTAEKPGQEKSKVPEVFPPAIEDGSFQAIPPFTYDLDVQSRMKGPLEDELNYMDLAKRECEFLKTVNLSAQADRCSQRDHQYLNRAYLEREIRERIKPPEVSSRPLPIPSGPCTGAPMNREAAAGHPAEVDHLLNRIAEMNRLLSRNQGAPLNLRARSPSPTPHFNASGKRTNTRKQRARNKLEQERHVLIQRLLKINPDYVPPKNYVPCSFVKSIPLPEEEYPEIKFRNLMIGRVIHEMEQETGTKMKFSSSDTTCGNIIKKPVYLEITAPSPDALTAAENVVEANVEMILQNNKAYVEKWNKQILNAEQKGCKIVRLLGINPEISSQDVCNLSDRIRLAKVNLPNQKSPMHTAKVVFGSAGNLKETLSTLHDSRLWGPNQSVGVIMFAYDPDKKGLVQPIINSIVPNLSKLTSNRTEMTNTTSQENNTKLSLGEQGKSAKRCRDEQENGEPAPKRQRITNQIIPKLPFIAGNKWGGFYEISPHFSLVTSAPYLISALPTCFNIALINS